MTGWQPWMDDFLIGALCVTVTLNAFVRVYIAWLDWDFKRRARPGARRTRTP